MTTGEINRRLVTKEKSNAIPEDVQLKIYTQAKELNIDPKLEKLKYGARSKEASTWIGGATQGMYPQFIPGMD
jgi:hypothetical protein